MPPRIDKAAFEALGNIIAPPPPKKKNRGDDKPWSPRLSPKQQEAFDSAARFILCDGEKGSGKTYGLIHKLVRHCYENQNALALILVKERSMATKGGAWDKLVNQVLPCWRDGNRDREGNLIDDGLGLEFSNVRYDQQHHEYIWIENMHGGWSMVTLLSEPHAHQLRETIRGYEPSFVLVDELTSCKSEEYLTAVAAQIGRRPIGGGIQQYTAACNPEGPSHWVHKKWFVEPFSEETGKWDPDYHRIHVPIEDNRPNLPDGYVENLEKLYKGDPIEHARMMRGEWIDRPSGEAIFRDVWSPIIHIRPEPHSLESILPTPGYPVIVGMDPGAAYNAFIFMQCIMMRWVIFDEVVTIRRRIPYTKLVPIFLRRLAWWLSPPEMTGTRVAYISDSSAFNQFRAAGGSYDVLEFQRIADLHTPQLGLSPMRVMQAPKFNGSVPTRTRLMMDALASEQLIVSARCKAVIAMFENLESQKQDPGKFSPELSLTPKRSDHIHVFDATSYPILTQAVSPQLLSAPAAQSTTEIIRIGS